MLKSEDLLIACHKASKNHKIDAIKLIDNIIAELKKEQVVDASKQECCNAQVDQAEDSLVKERQEMIDEFDQRNVAEVLWRADDR